MMYPIFCGNVQDDVFFALLLMLMLHGAYITRLSVNRSTPNTVQYIHG
jgi:hypothetical protein